MLELLGCGTEGCGHVEVGWGWIGISEDFSSLNESMVLSSPSRMVARCVLSLGLPLQQDAFSLKTGDQRMLRRLRDF